MQQVADCAHSSLLRGFIFHSPMGSIAPPSRDVHMQEKQAEMDREERAEEVEGKPTGSVQKLLDGCRGTAAGGRGREDR